MAQFNFGPDILGFASASNFPAVGEANKYYVAEDVNVMYRYGQNGYVAIGYASDMTGATSSAAGTHGLVPAPAAGDQNKVLAGDGTWQVSPGAKVYPKTVTITNTSGSYSHTFEDEDITSDMKAVELEYTTPYVYGAPLSVDTANGSFTVTCSSLEGSDTVTISFIKVIDDPTAVTSTEFDILNNRLLAVENVTTIQDITILTSDWTLTNGVYKYEWTNSIIQSGSDVVVLPRDGAEESGVEGIEADKATGKVVFTSAELPSGNIPLTVKIINAKPDGLQSLNASDISTSAITGCDDVEEALTSLSGDLGSKSSASAVTGNDAFSKISALNGKLPTLLWTNPSVSATGEATIAHGINFNNFTLFAVKTRVNVGIQRYVIQLVYIGEETQISYVTDSSTQNANVWYRYITINNGNIYVTNATRGDGTNNTSALIPEALYGIM